MAALRGSSAARDELPEAAALNAPLFRSLVDGLQDGKRRVILDLGPPQPATVALFRGHRCRLEIADFANGLDVLNAELAAGTRREVTEAMLPKRRDEPTDIVLCWDLLNYLERPALAALMSVLAERLRPRALVHALVIYSTPRMALRPLRIAPSDDARLLCQARTGEQKNAPRYTPEDLAKCTPDFEVERAVLLKNGMQEFLFRR